MRAVLALDQGTTSSRAILFDAEGLPLAVAREELPQSYPKPGWVEQDPEAIWRTQWNVARIVLNEVGIATHEIVAVGITNQRETTLIWNRRTGAPIHPAIVWQDRRTAPFCDALRKGGQEPWIQERTGLVIDAYFSASKIGWLLDHVPDARAQAERGELAFGTVDSWLLWKLTGGARHVTDPTNASRTLLYNLHSGSWDDELLKLFSIPRSLMPEIVPSNSVIGETVPGLFHSPLTLAGIAGDQQAALFGQNCLSRGLAKCTYGTGCFLLMNIGSQPIPSQHRLLTTVACPVDHQPQFAMEGSVFIGGAVVQWLRDGLGLIRSANEIEALAASVPDHGGVYFVPAFAGLGAPHWDQYARGSLAGLTRGTTAGHLARAALEGIAFQVADVLDVMREDSKIPMDELRVDGGAASNNLLMQFQSDILQIPVVRPKITETTALGAAFLAGSTVGFWKDAAALNASWQVEQRFEPQMSTEQAKHRRERWAKALLRAREWEEPV
jgi:glycerol kinase